VDHSRLDAFLATCDSAVAAHPAPADVVAALAEPMRRLVVDAADILTPAHYRSDPEHYARNLVHADPDGGLSLFALVWLPGQWTPVHDHGTWGVVGVVEGVLTEQAYMRVDPGAYRNARDRDADRGIDLRRGGLVLLAPGAVSTFVPNPDHIHRTGVPDDRPRAVSLHLYGRMMDRFHTYDVAAGTRTLIDAPHFRS
jgi:predicted metal-dependent enzyme (double-stranded beta helix superfamily)